MFSIVPSLSFPSLFFLHSLFPHNFVWCEREDLDQSETRCEGIFRNNKTGDWNIPWSVITRDRGWDWIGEPASSGNHQYPHHAFFFGCNTCGCNHAMDKFYKVREQIA